MVVDLVLDEWRLLVLKDSQGTTGVLICSKVGAGGPDSTKYVGEDLVRNIS